jgi:branched-subunit amino acid transport protein AzlD
MVTGLIVYRSQTDRQQFVSALLALMAHRVLSGLVVLTRTSATGKKLGVGVSTIAKGQGIGLLFFLKVTGSVLVVFVAVVLIIMCLFDAQSWVLHLPSNQLPLQLHLRILRR